MTLEQLASSLTSGLSKRFPPIKVNVNWQAPNWLKTGAARIVNQAKPVLQQQYSLRGQLNRPGVQTIRRFPQYVGQTVQGQTPLMKRLQQYQSQRTPYTPEFKLQGIGLRTPQQRKVLAETLEAGMYAAPPVAGVANLGRVGLSKMGALKGGLAMAGVTAGLQKLRGEKITPQGLAMPLALGAAFGGLEPKGSIAEAERLKAGKIKTPEIPLGMKERGFIKTVKESAVTAGQVAEKVKGLYKPITNRETIRKAGLALDTEGWDIAKARVIKEPLSAETNALGQLITKRAQDAGRYDEAIEMVETLAKKGTEQGQAVQSFAIWSKLTPEGMLRYANKQVATAKETMGFATKFARKMFGKKAPEITSEDAKTITTLMKQANGAKTEVEQAKYVRLALEKVNERIPWGVSDVVDTYRYNNMLSNPLTHLRNFWSNTINTFIVRPATLATEGRPKEAVNYEVAALKAIPSAFGAFFKAFKGETPLDMAKVDIQSVKAGKAPLALSVPTRAMEAADKFFNAIIQAGEIARGRPKEEAYQTAEYFLLRGGLNEAGQGHVLNALDTIPKALYAFRKIPGLGWTIPFVRTPFNWAKMMLEYSPTGVVTTWGANDKRTQLSKAVLGSMASLWGTKMALEGRTTWRAPVDPEEKELFYASGRKPFSVLIGDKWVPMANFGVFQWALGLPAAAQYYQQENRTALTDDQLTKLARTAEGIIYMWSQSSPMAGLGGFVRLMEGDIDLSFSRNLAFTLGQFKPAGGLVSYITKALDPIYRRPGGFVEQVKSELPILSKQVPAYTEPSGEPSRRNPLYYMMPYGPGISKPEYEQPLQERTFKLQQNARGNKLKKDLERWVGMGKQGPVTQDLIAGMVRDLGSKTYQARFHKLVKKGADPVKVYEILSKQKKVETLKKQISAITNDNSLTPGQKIEMKRPLVEELKKLKGGR